jgi:plastocyanin
MFSPLFAAAFETVKTLSRVSSAPGARVTRREIGELPVATETSARISSTRRTAGGRSPLSMVVIGALLVVAGTSVVGQILAGGVIPPEMVILFGALIGAGVMAIPWRWSMSVPLFVSVLLIIGSLTSGFPQYALSHPTDRDAFATLAIQFGMLSLTAAVCLLLLVQTLRGTADKVPTWTTPAIAGMVGLTLGALLIGLIAQPEGAPGVASNTAGTKTVHLAAVSFAPDIVALHTGDTLTIVDDAPIPHTITNGVWSADNKPVPGVEPGAPIISNLEVNNTTATVGPFTTAGTYHLYCTLHPGMTLTILVQ